jgi:hypothetical protein
MGQLTKPHVEAILAQCKRREYPNLTVWELQQLAWAWIELRSLQDMGLWTARFESDSNKA